MECISYKRYKKKQVDTRTKNSKKTLSTTSFIHSWRSTKNLIRFKFELVYLFLLETRF